MTDGERALGMGAFVGLTTFSYQKRVVRRLRKMNHPAAFAATVVGVCGMGVTSMGSDYIWLSYTTEPWYRLLNLVSFPPIPPCNYHRKTVADALLLLGEYLERLRRKSPGSYPAVSAGAPRPGVTKGKSPWTPT